MMNDEFWSRRFGRHGFSGVLVFGKGTFPDLPAAQLSISNCQVARKEKQ